MPVAYRRDTVGPPRRRITIEHRMSERTAEIVICGAGIAGVAAAYHLAVRRGVSDIVLVDERPPLSLTSDKSAECYRNWWPGPGDAMVAAMNRSIDLLEELARESGNVFRMNRRGYLFATADPARVPHFVRAAQEAAALGAGRCGCTTGRAVTIARPRPTASRRSRRGATSSPIARSSAGTSAGWRRTRSRCSTRGAADGSAASSSACTCSSARATRACGCSKGRVERVETAGGRVTAVQVSGAGGTHTVSTPRFVVAAGPLLKTVGRLLGVELPVFCERHAKVAFNDVLGAMPRDAPMTIWTDPVRYRGRTRSAPSWRTPSTGGCWTNFRPACTAARRARARASRCC